MSLTNLNSKVSATGLLWFSVALLAYLVYVWSITQISTSARTSLAVPDSVVLPATFQTVIYGGDRYLAANIESTRVLMAGEAIVSGKDQDYLYRNHTVVADLNPCHEDNYYVANALLSWGGNVDAALDILRIATKCRFWDEVPPFFLGYNLYFFKYQNQAAKDLLFEAAERSPKNRVGLQKFGVMIEAEGIPDVHMAKNYLIDQRTQARDKKLKDMLGLRIARLEGLIVLRDAQVSYEKRTGRPLRDPQDLISNRYLAAFPNDPIGLGYTFSDGIFAMKEVGVSGVTRPLK
ncbi:MAG: hypothetical protein IPJ25_13150 [Rhodocyclaceae bacterium]|nr:hypothetical protein [Rhodocyclaceae bacterium]MBL0074511.1 hypothetical protein [Rhodocyclaceae bacterium]